METIDLGIEILNNKSEFSDVIVKFDKDTFYLNQSLLKNKLYFNNCIFIEDVIISYLIDKKFSIRFHNCSFEGNLQIHDCELKRLQITFLKKIKDITIENSEFENLIINSNNEPIKGNITIENCGISGSILCNQLNIEDGEFNIDLNNESKKEQNDFRTSFEKSTFDVLSFSYTVFGENSSFKSMKIKNSTNFLNCEFKKTLFDDVNFGKNSFFYSCKFHSYSSFKKCLNIENTNIKLSNCLFTSIAYFNNSKFNSFEIENTNFDKKVSFENFNTNLFIIYQVSFSDSVYFDDLNKQNESVIKNWDRKTLRAIKRELVNSHNQIDYLRFKACELEAYKKEKGKNWKDSFILFFNEQSNYFGLDWFKGLKFTLYTSFICYLLYIITFAIVIKSIVHLPNSVEDFFVNYLKFLNPFSFLKSPIEESEKYFFPFLFFIIGKIFVSYGIYQTVQAFRKFGVNGG